MSNQNDFVTGLYVDKKDTQYGEIIKLSFKSEAFINWVKANTNEKGYCNVDILSTKEGKKYAKLNSFKPTQSPASVPNPTQNTIPTGFTNTSTNTATTDELPF